MQKIKIGNRHIGDGKTYVIAEAGVNHNGSLERAKELVIEAAKAGADAIKFQTYTADDLVVKGTPKFWDWDGDFGKDQWQCYKDLEGFKKEWYPELIECCEKNNIEFISTPFSIEAADFLNSLGMRAFKIASCDLSYLALIEHVAKFGKPIFLSTGASTIEEIHEAVDTIRDAGNEQIIILHCTLCYPTTFQDANFNTIETLRKAFPHYSVGLSDHTLGTFAPAIAVAMGARVIEKHYTLDNELGKSADHWLSVDPWGLEKMVENIRTVEELGGSSKKRILTCEKESRLYDKRSIVTTAPIDVGEVISLEKLACKRPGTGISPKHLKSIIGRIAKNPLPKDMPLQWTDV